MNAPTAITPDLIAPCGMNCGICIGHFRQERRCFGCNSPILSERQYCRHCSIKTCLERGNAKFCYACDKFPCRRLKQLDKRYRLKYRMSMLENLAFIKTKGIRRFVTQEKIRWTCRACGSLLCVHRENCLVCGAIWGLGGLTWGLMIRYLGVGLGLAMGAGLTSAAGTSRNVYVPVPVAIQ